MSASLTTINYGLGKYAPDDVTNWLIDFNGNMDKIDAGMEANKQAAAAANDKATNAAASVAALTESVQENTASIEANEKAISANTAGIENLETEIGGIYVGDVIASPADVSKIEPLVNSVTCYLRRLGNFASGTCALNVRGGTCHQYDRIGTGLINGSYLTDIARYTGNPFNLAENVYTPGRCIAVYTDSSSALIQIAVAYLSDSNYTVLCFINGTSGSSPITFAKDFNGLCVF